MAFLDELGKKLGSAANATASKAKELAEIGKLNADIGSEERKIEKAYTEIGKIVFAQAKENPPAEIAQWVQKIQESMAQIAENQQKIREIKEDTVPREEAATEYVEVEVIEEKATCPHCGQDAPREAKFCPNCGGLMEIES